MAIFYNAFSNTQNKQHTLTSSAKKNTQTLLGLFTTQWSGKPTNEEWSSLEKLSREAADIP